MSAAHPQSRIDELTLQNRTLSHTIQKLKNELSNEQGRFHTSMTDLQTKWQSEKDQWTEMQHCYRIHQLKLVVQLEELRVMLEKQKEEIRKLTLQKAVKEAEVVLAQGKVTDLKWTMEGLEEELKDVRGDTEEAEEAWVGQYQAAVEKLKRKCKEFADETKEKTTELEEAQKERDELEVCVYNMSDQYLKFLLTGLPSPNFRPSNLNTRNYPQP
jgi:chromosome segregation ATPase